MSPRVVTRTRELTVCLSVPVIVMIRMNHLDPCFPVRGKGWGHTQQGSQQGEGTFGFSPRGVRGFPSPAVNEKVGPVRLGRPDRQPVGGSGPWWMPNVWLCRGPRSPGLVLSPPTPLAAPSLSLTPTSLGKQPDCPPQIRAQDGVQRCGSKTTTGGAEEQPQVSAASSAQRNGAVVPLSGGG